MLDFADPQFSLNPYPALAELRTAGRPVWHEETGMFLASRHADANAVLRSKTLGRIFKPREPESEWHEFNYLHADSLLDSEPPKHTRLKSLISKSFNPTTIRQLRPNIESIANRMLDECEDKLAKNGSFDLLADFAEPLPVKVISHLLGFPSDQEHLLRPWSQAIVKMYEVAPSEQHKRDAKAASQEFAAFVNELMQNRIENPGDDLISSLSLTTAEGDRLSETELIATCVLLLNAGHEASVNGFGNGMVAALGQPEVIAPLRSEPGRVSPTAVEEFVRFDSPLQLFERTATADTEIGGVEIKTGQKIAALLGSANRDETVFEESTRMNLERDPNPHIAFGAGIHFCIGAPLARLEMNIALPLLIERFPGLELAAEPIRRPSFVLRGYETVPVTNP